MKYVLTALITATMNTWPAIYHGWPSLAFSSDVAINGVIELDTIPEI